MGYSKPFSPQQNVHLNDLSQARMNNTGPQPLLQGIHLDNDSIRHAIEMWFEDQESAVAVYGHISTWNTSLVTDMSKLFADKKDFNENIDPWDVSRVTTMEAMFEGAESFNQSLNSWDVSNVSNFCAMFKSATSFNQPLNQWNLGHAMTTEKMFCKATSFNQPLDQWDVKNVVIMASMFENAKAFNQRLDSWNTSNVQRMNDMFNGASLFNQPLNHWIVGNVTTMRNMFLRATRFNQPLDLWNTSNVSDFSYIFSEASAFNQSLNSWNMSNAIALSYMFYKARSFNQALNDWDVSKVQYMDDMFNRAASFNQPLNCWSLSEVLTMRRMFCGAVKFNQPLCQWNVQSVVDMMEMFQSAISFNQPLSMWDVSNVDDMSYMFRDATSFNQPLDDWLTCSLVRSQHMFEGATAFNQPLNSWDVEGVRSMESMFENATSFNQPLNNWAIGKYTKRDDMFKGATAFVQPVDQWTQFSTAARETTSYKLSSALSSFTGKFDILKTPLFNQVGGGARPPPTTVHSLDSVKRPLQSYLVSTGVTQATTAPKGVYVSIETLDPLLEAANNGDINAWLILSRDFMDHPYVQRRLSTEQMDLLQNMASSTTSGITLKRNDANEETPTEKPASCATCDICLLEYTLHMCSTHLDSKVIGFDDTDMTPAGRGGEGEVLKGTLLCETDKEGAKLSSASTSQVIALKTLHTENQLLAKDEMNKLMFLSHCKHFPRCLGHTVLSTKSCDDKNASKTETLEEAPMKCFVILEFARYGDLDNLVGALVPISFDDYGQLVNYPLPLSLIVQWLLSVAKALQAMHVLHLKHLDVKPKNILVFDNFEVKLADLGLTRQAEEGESMTSSDDESDGYFTSKAVNHAIDDACTTTISGNTTGLRGTAGYCAPDKNQTTANDIFSLGMTAIHLMNLKRPSVFSWRKDIQRALSWWLCETDSSLGPLSSDNMESLATRIMFCMLIEDCVSDDPEQRPSAKDCVVRLSYILQQCTMSNTTDVFHAITSHLDL